MNQIVDKIREKVKSTKIKHANYEKAAIRIIRQKEWCVLPEDKKPGYALMSKRDLKAVFEEVLSGDSYTEISPNSVNIPTIEAVYSRLCSRVAKVTENQKNFSMTYKSWHPTRSLYSKLNITVKTHKPNGEVTVRDIQSNSQDKWGGLSRWVSVELRKRIDKIPHILKDSRHLVKLLRHQIFPRNTCVLTADIDHFFMSGTPHQIRKDLEGYLAT